jgi:hypothetical protein
MSQKDLELLITLDEPDEEEDVHHLPEFENTVIDDGPYPVVFGEGDWTCTLSRLGVTTDDPMRGPNGNMIQSSKQKFEIGVCIVACSKHGQIVEQKVFYDLVGMQKQIGVR